MPAPALRDGRPGAKSATRRQSVRVADGLPLPVLGVGKDVLRRDAAPPQFVLDFRDGFGFHALAIGSDAIEQVDGFRLPDISFYPFPVVEHGGLRRLQRLLSHANRAGMLWEPKDIRQRLNPGGTMVRLKLWNRKVFATLPNNN